ncbi:MAG: glycosyltransferase family 2 protein [Oscillatoria princeps RMCB-10]|nr:glycosyltransferase family 2 protein [Oscillatoria princeps RMCB-10]
MERLLVSVIVPVYNGERYLSAALESIFAQDYHPFEVIVVDDGSVDSTAAIAKSFKSVQYIYQTNQGIANAMNRGIDAAGGELIAFLDQDDLWTPNKLRLQVDYLVNHPEIQYAISLVKFFLEPGCSVPPGFKTELLEKEQVGRIPGALMARKSLLALIGQFNAEFTIASDADWFARAKDSNIPWAVIPEVLLHKRVHNTNVSSNARLNNKELLALLRKSIARQQKSTQE